MEVSVCSDRGPAPGSKPMSTIKSAFFISQTWTSSLHPGQRGVQWGEGAKDEPAHPGVPTICPALQLLSHLLHRAWEQQGTGLGAPTCPSLIPAPCCVACANEHVLGPEQLGACRVGLTLRRVRNHGDPPHPSSMLGWEAGTKLKSKN